ncbi:MAG: immunoglobulin domain-containing protein [Nitrospirae bacterium]|nr:immunoglobulin domain-containing protein [Nitrospirota bacterium]
MTTGHGPFITVQPQSQIIALKGSVTLSVVATGQGLLRYQWYKNGEAINNQTKSSFSISVFRNADIGRYDVVVWDDTGKIQSNVVTLDMVVMSVEERIDIESLDDIKRHYKESFFMVGKIVVSKDVDNNPLIVDYVNPVLSGYKLRVTNTYVSNIIDTSVSEILAV